MILLLNYPASKAKGCLSVCLFVPNSSEMAKPIELQFSGNFLLQVDGFRQKEMHMVHHRQKQIKK